MVQGVNTDMITCDDVGFDQVIQHDDDEDLVGIIGVSDKEGFNCGPMDNGSDFGVKGSSSVKTNIVYPSLSDPAGTVRTMYVHCTYIVPTVRTMYVHCTYSARWGGGNTGFPVEW